MPAIKDKESWIVCYKKQSEGSYHKKSFEIEEDARDEYDKYPD